MEREGSSFYVVLYDSVEGWYLSSRDSSLEKGSWERSDFSTAVTIVLSQDLEEARSRRGNIQSISFSGLASSTARMGGGREVRHVCCSI